MSVRDEIPEVAQAAYDGLSEDQQAHFANQYNSKKRSAVVMVILAVVLPIQMFFLDKVGLGVLFWLTGFGFGIWWIVEWFLTPGRVRAYNEQLAIRIITEIKALSS